MGVINPRARCRNCGQPATDRKRQYCSGRCRRRLRLRRMRWAAQIAKADDPAARLVAVEIDRHDGAAVWTEWHRISDPPSAFDRFVLEHARASLRHAAGARPGRR